MKNEKAYIRAMISTILAKFPFIGIRYEFKSSSETHFVEVTPKEILENRDFIEFKLDALTEFYKKFDDSGIVFISTDSLVVIEHPEIEFKCANQSEILPKIIQPIPKYEIVGSTNDAQLLDGDNLVFSDIIIEQRLNINQTIGVSILTVVNDFTVDEAGNIDSVPDFQIHLFPQQKGWIRKMLSAKGRNEITPNYNYALAA